MKGIDFTSENYEFKKAMNQKIKKDIEPLMFDNNFVKYGSNKFIRETDNLAQIVSFSVTNDLLKAYAMFLPIFLPNDNYLNYGIEITGSDGIYLLKGKYFTTIYEKEKHDKTIQFQHYKEQHLDNFNKLLLSIKEGVLPEMEQANSLGYFIKKIENEEGQFFGKKYVSLYKNGALHKFIIGVYTCLYEQFQDGVKKLQDLEKHIGEDDVKGYIKRLLYYKETENFITKEKFLNNYTEICNEKRKKYKLIK